jgi:hypothetical protein
MQQPRFHPRRMAGQALWNTRFAIPQSLPRHLAGVNLASSILRVPPAGIWLTHPAQAL